MDPRLVTFIIILLMFLSFIYIMKTGDQELMYTQGRNVRLREFRLSPQAVVVSPSGVRVVPIVEYNDNGSIDDSKSPYPGYVNKRSIVELNKSNSPDKKNLFVFNEDRNFGSIGEKLSCRIVEEYLGREVKVGIRPDFLKNPKTNRNLELDIYDEETKIAVEYNGAQHYRKTSLFHKSDDEFVKQKERDILKVELCEKEGVKLIIVPYTVDVGKKTSDGDWKTVSVSEAIREVKLRKYITSFMDSFLIE